MSGSRYLVKVQLLTARKVISLIFACDALSEVRGFM